MRNLFDQDDDNDFYDGIEYFFSENNFEYEEIKEYDNDIYEIIKQEEVKYEHIEEANYVKIKQKIGQEKKNKQCLIDCQYMVIKEKKVEYCKVEDQNDIGYEKIKILMSVKVKKETIIEDNIECEIIENRKVDYYELTKDKKDEEIKEYANDIYEIIKQEEVKYEHIEEAIYVKTKPCLIVNEKVISQEKKNKQCLIDCEYIVIKEKKLE